MAEKLFTIIVERDEDGVYIGQVKELPGCHTQAFSLDVLMSRLAEAIDVYRAEETRGRVEEVLGC